MFNLSYPCGRGGGGALGDRGGIFLDRLFIAAGGYPGEAKRGADCYGDGSARCPYDPPNTREAGALYVGVGE